MCFLSFKKILITSILLIFNLSANAEVVICEKCNDGNMDTVCYGKIVINSKSGAKLASSRQYNTCQGTAISLRSGILREMHTYNQNLEQANQLLSNIAKNVSLIPSFSNDSIDTKNLLNKAITSNKELRATINKKFDQIPSELAVVVMNKLKEEILLEIDNRLSDK